MNGCPPPKTKGVVNTSTNKSNQSRHPAETQTAGAVFGARGASGCGGLWYTPPVRILPPCTATASPPRWLRPYKNNRASGSLTGDVTAPPFLCSFEIIKTNKGRTSPYGSFVLARATGDLRSACCLSTITKGGPSDAPESNPHVRTSTAAGGSW
jgi:hypothetical protein